MISMSLPETSDIKYIGLLVYWPVGSPEKGSPCPPIYGGFASLAANSRELLGNRADLHVNQELKPDIPNHRADITLLTELLD